MPTTLQLPTGSKTQDDFTERHPEVGLLGGAVELINTQGQVFKNGCALRRKTRKSDLRRFSRSPIFHSPVIMRKVVVLAAGGYRKALLDADAPTICSFEIGERSRFATLAKPGLQYRIHANQVSVRDLRRQVLCMLAASAASSLKEQLGSSLSPFTPGRNTVTTPDTLGVSTVRIQQALLDGYGYWLDVLRQSEPEAALRVADKLFQLSGSGCVERSVLANAWLTAAGIHYSRRGLQKR